MISTRAITPAPVPHVPDLLVTNSKEPAMTSGATDTPASLYGGVSSVLGFVALITVALVAYVGIAIPLLCGSLAVTLASLGLNKHLNRALCAVGLGTGGAAVLYVLFLLFAFSS